MSASYLMLYLELTAAPQPYLCKTFPGLYTGLEKTFLMYLC